jgi:SAM-dependent methyltransferase
MKTPRRRARPVDPRIFEVDRTLLLRGGPAPHAGWGNLGDWSDARTYAEACAALAARVGRAAGLGAGDRVLEVACGDGDGLVLWLDAFGVRCAVGAELHPERAAAARARVAAWPADRARVDTASATDLGVHAAASVDAVVAVDAAYHFDPRARFFAEARRVLAPGGRLALTDLVLARAPRGAARAALLRAAARACAIPPENLLDERAYAARLADAGFVDVAFERLDDAVLAGFAAFVRAQLGAHGFAAPRVGWAKIAGAALAAALVHRRGWAHYVLVSAKAGARST